MGNGTTASHQQQILRGELVQFILNSLQTLLTGGTVAALRSPMEETKGFLENLQLLNTPGKLKNLRHNAAQIRGHENGLTALADVETLYELVSGLGELTAYLTTADAVLPVDHPWVAQARSFRGELLNHMADTKQRSAPSFFQTTREKLLKLKSDYAVVYGALHTRDRLGVNEEKRAVALKIDPRLARLKRLSTIDLLPASQLVSFQNRLAGLAVCHRLSQRELEIHPVCPHCAYKPNTDSLATPAATLLTKLAEELDGMVDGWTSTMLDNLQAPTSKKSLSLLGPDTRKLVDDFLAQRHLPGTLEHDFIHAVGEVLFGLEKITISDHQIKEILLGNGSPATVDELRERFERFIEGLVRGKEQGKIRIVLE